MLFLLSFFEFFLLFFVLFFLFVRSFVMAYSTPLHHFLLLVSFISTLPFAHSLFLYFIRFTVFHIFNILPILVTLHTLFPFLFLFFLVVYSCNLLILQDIVLSLFSLPLCVLSPFELLFLIFLLSFCAFFFPFEP